jgi:hypothetical protein
MLTDKQHKIHLGNHWGMAWEVPVVLALERGMAMDQGIQDVWIQCLPTSNWSWSSARRDEQF